MGESKYNVSGLAEAKTNLKKKTLRSSQAQTERVQKLRTEYWLQVQHIPLENLVFLDETGVLLGLTRTYARSSQGCRAYDFKPFYRRTKVTVIGAMSLKPVLAVMTLNGSKHASPSRGCLKSAFVILSGAKCNKNMGFQRSIEMLHCAHTSFSMTFWDFSSIVSLK
jgi:hypothetical protein